MKQENYPDQEIINASLKEVENLIQNSKFDEAFDIINKLDEKYPFQPEIYMAWANLYLLSGDVETASGKFQILASHYLPDKSYYDDWRRWILGLPKNYIDKGLESYRQEVESELKSLRDYLDLAILYVELGKAQEAETVFLNGLNLHSNGYDNSQIHNIWSKMLEERGFIDMALSHKREAVRLNPANYQLYDEFKNFVNANIKTTSAYFELGKFVSSLFKFEDAIEWFKRAKEINGVFNEWSRFYTNWGHALFQLGRYGEALIHFKEAYHNQEDINLALDNWLYTLYNLRDSEKEVLEFIDIVHKHSDNLDYNRYIGEAYDLIGNKEKAVSFIEAYTKQNELNPRGLFLFGNILLDLQQYENAKIQFTKCTALPDPDRTDTNYIFSFHNLAFIHEKLGHYKVSRDYWRDAVKAYQEAEKSFLEKRNAISFSYWGSIYQYSLFELDKAEECYLKGLEIDPQNTQILVNLVKIHISKRNEQIAKNDESREAKNLAHSKAWNHFRHVERILLRKGKEGSISEQILLGELYLVMEKYQQAKGVLTAVLKDDPNSKEASAKLGLVYLKLDNYDQAIYCMQEAIKEDNDSLQFRSNLAEAYLKKKLLLEAETEYRRNLDVTEFHLESVMGLGEVYKEMAEEALSNGNKDDSEEMFNQSLYYYNRVLELDQLPDKTSKKLSQTELSSINYARGYVNVKLYEFQSNTKHLIVARNNFRNVNPNSKDYFKSQRAVKKINDRLGDLHEVAKQRGSQIIVAASLIFLVITQFAFYIGRPRFERDNYHIQNNNLTKLETIKLDSTISKRIIDLKNNSFSDKSSMMKSLNLDDNNFNLLLNKEIIAGTGDLRLISYTPIDSTSYGLLTFGALIFTIAGLFLNELRKLKFGVIEMEKSSVDRDIGSTNLGIN